MTDGTSTPDLLSSLISEGESLVPQGGSTFDGYNGALQPSYVSWRHRSFAAIQELGSRATHILKDLEDDKNGPYFFEASAGRVLGAIQAAHAIATRHTSSSPKTTSTVPDEASTSKVFVVHGHDRVLLEQLARFLEKLSLEPIILFEQPAAGQTIVEKLERHSEVTAAVVLLTPDDIGRSAALDATGQPRARQNVVLELGFFMGRLGREKIVVLHDESVELPSDYRGVEYIKLDPEAAWKLKVARELKHAGLAIDMNKAI